MPTAEKAMKKRDCTQSAANKDQTTNAGGRRKMAAITRQTIS